MPQFVLLLFPTAPLVPPVIRPLVTKQIPVIHMPSDWLKDVYRFHP